MALASIFAALCLIALLLTSIQVVLAWLHFSMRPSSRSRLDEFDRAGDGPFVSILKPVCGIDDELEENLISFANLAGISYEVILSVAREDDPAIEVIERVRRKFLEAPFLLVVGGPARQSSANPKVERLKAADRTARGDVLLISDSNVRVSRSDIARTVTQFDDETVGCVSNPFVAEGGVSFGSILESLNLLTFVLPGNVIAAASKVTCVVGKSMAVKREALERIGGFSAFSNVLAEDQAMALAIKTAGYRVLLSSTIVRNISVRKTLGQVLSRQGRWGKMRYAFSKKMFVIEFLANPLPLAILACATGAASGVDRWTAASLPAAVVVVSASGRRALADCRERS